MTREDLEALSTPELHWMLAELLRWEPYAVNMAHRDMRCAQEAGRDDVPMRPTAVGWPPRSASPPRPEILDAVLPGQLTIDQAIDRPQ